MKLVEKWKEKGISLRITSILMFIVSLAITAALLFTAVETVRSFRRLAAATDDYMELEDAADTLMAASDYLTEEAQAYTAIGDRQHMDNYFREANETRRRENALYVLKQKAPESNAFHQLQQAMTGSLDLMNREYYAMRLTAEAKGETDLPTEVEAVELSEADRKLDAQQKMDLSRELMHDAEYYRQKENIRADMGSCVETLKKETHDAQDRMEKSARRMLGWMIALIIIQSGGILVMLWMNSTLGIRPVLRAVDHIRKDEELPIIGAHEFRYLAGTYNKMYAAYKRSIENLNFKASHDELTGVYNRAGYELIRTSVDPATTAMLIFDADIFKDVNDTEGHETGDEVLKKIATVLSEHFRSDDYVCRVGGDEFVVFMVHLKHNPEKLIETKVERINEALSDTSDGLPAISLSAGVALPNENADSQEMFRRADLALYYVKEHGRHGCCFYHEMLSQLKKENRAAEEN